MTAHSCGRCPARWGGANTSHCNGCHQTFGGVSAFDKHRTLAGECRAPESVGLTVGVNGYWSAPMSEASKAAFRMTPHTTGPAPSGGAGPVPSGGPSPSLVGLGSPGVNDRK